MSIGKLFASLSFLLVLGWCNPAQSALTFEFGQSTYFATPNSTVDVDVFLAATGADRDFLLATSAGRIFALGVRVNSNQVGIGASVVSASDIAVNTATFDDTIATPVTDVGPGFARAAAFTNDPNGVSLPDVNPLRVRLGTFRYTLGPTIGVTTTLSFEDFDASTNIAASDGLGGAIALDGLVDFSRTASIVAVPEPGSLLLLTGAGVLGLIRQGRKRAAGKKAQQINV